MHKNAQKILDATIALFVREGIHKATMDDIAQNARVSKMTVYKYFTDKDTLYLRVGTQLLREQGERLAAVAASGQGTYAKFCAALDCVAAFADSGSYALCGELAACNHRLDAQWARYREAYQWAVYVLIAEGQTAGCMRAGLDAEMLFSYIDMGVCYYQQNEAYRRKMRADAAFSTQFMRFFIGNVCAFAPPEA